MASRKGYCCYKHPVTGETAILTKEEADRRGFRGIMSGRSNHGVAKRRMKRLRATFPDGSSSEFDSIQNASAQLGIHVNTLSRRLKVGGSPERGPGAGMLFEFV